MLRTIETARRMVNSKLVQTRTKVNTKVKNSTAHVTYLSFLCIELFNRYLEQKSHPSCSEVWYFSLILLLLRFYVSQYLLSPK